MIFESIKEGSILYMVSLRDEAGHIWKTDVCETRDEAEQYIKLLEDNCAQGFATGYRLTEILVGPLGEWQTMACVGPKPDSEVAQP